MTPQQIWLRADMRRFGQCHRLGTMRTEFAIFVMRCCLVVSKNCGLCQWLPQLIAPWVRQLIDNYKARRDAGMI